MPQPYGRKSPSKEPMAPWGWVCTETRRAAARRPAHVMLAGVSLRARAASAWRILGPGFVTGSSDDDPSGIQTYSQTGAQFGYSQLWIAAWTYPFMNAIQEICGRIGMVTGRGMAAVLREHYSRPVLYVAVSLLLIANTVNVGADLGAMAATGQLIIHLAFTCWLAVIVGILLALQIFVPYPAYARFLKYACRSLLAHVALLRRSGQRNASATIDGDDHVGRQ